MICERFSKKMNSPKTFYWFFRPIAVLCKLSGVIPLENIHFTNGSKIRYRKLSFAQIYSGLIFYSTIYLVYYFSGFVFDDSNHEPSFIWKCAVAYLMIIRAVICFTYCSRNSKKFIKLIHLLENFDLKRKEMLDIQPKCVMRQIIILTIVPMLFGILWLSMSFIELGQFMHQLLKPEIRLSKGRWASHCFGMLGIWRAAPLFLYVYFAKMILLNFKDINRSIIGKASHLLWNEGKNENSAKYLSNLRQMYGIMARAVTQLSKSYGCFLAIDQFCIIVMFVINTYVFCFNDNNDIHLLLCTILNGWQVLMAIHVSHQLKEESIKTLELIAHIKYRSLSKTTNYEYKAFLLQVSSSPVSVSAAGFFIMDRTQIPSILSTVATYIIVLVQFSDKINVKYENSTAEMNSIF